MLRRLDLSAITSPYEEEERGYPPYHPVMMTQVLLYGYAVGIYSGRKLAKALDLTVLLVEQNLPFIAALAKRVLIIQRGEIVAEIQPDDLHDKSIVDEYLGI